MNAMLFLLRLSVSVLVLSFAVAGFAQNIPGAVHTYESYGFSVSLPSTCQPVSLGSAVSGAGLQDAYSANGLAYVVLGITPTLPNGMNVRTAVSMGIQQISAASSKIPDANVNFVSATTADGEGVQGFSTSVTESNRSGMSKIPPEVKALLGSSVYQAAVLLPVKDSPATIGVIAVVGPSDRQGEIISQMMQVVATFTRGKSAAAVNFTSGLSGSRDILDATGGKDKKTAEAPPQPKIKPINDIKKGQIELVGLVKSTDAANKCLDMLVTQAVPFGGNGAILSPPRLKRVYVKEIAEGVKEGVIVIVVAGDTGPGKAVTAEAVMVMDPSKLGL